LNFQGPYLIRAALLGKATRRISETVCLHSQTLTENFRRRKLGTCPRIPPPSFQIPKGARGSSGPLSPYSGFFPGPLPLSPPQVVWNEDFMEGDEKNQRPAPAPYRLHARDADPVPGRNHLPLCPGPIAPTSRGPTPQLRPLRRRCSAGIPSAWLWDRQTRERRRTSAGTL
jgi:hypothetical protein